jgi:hypothetical protein
MASHSRAIGLSYFYFLPFISRRTNSFFRRLSGSVSKFIKCDPLLRRQMLYPPELRARSFYDSNSVWASWAFNTQFILSMDELHALGSCPALICFTRLVHRPEIHPYIRWTIARWIGRGDPGEGVARCSRLVRTN